MKALVDMQDKKILILNDREVTFWGKFDDIQASGRAVWKPVPDGADPTHLVVDNVTGAISVDPAKLAAQAAKDTARNERQARIKAHNASSAPTLAALKLVVADILAEIRGD